VNSQANLVSLPDHSQTLKAMLAELINERDRKKQRADQEARRSVFALVR
jgi:hypothetical protein